MCANIAYMHLFKIPWVPVMRLYDLYLPIVHLAFDVSLFWLFSYILSFGNGKIQQFLGFFITLIWAFINVAYSRFFGQYLSLSAVVEFFNNSTGGWWVDYIFLAFRWSDLFLVATIVIFILIIKREDKVCSNFVFSFCFPFCVVALYFGLINPLFSALKSKGDTIVFVDDQDFNSPSFMTFWLANPDRQIVQYGIFRTQIYFALFPVKDMQLSEDEIQSINEFVDNSPHLACGSTDNCKKNIFFILIELYLSSTSDLSIGGKEVTPTLNKLRHQDGTYFNGNIVKNISVGESSDGQLIYWTGLFPLKTEISIPYIVNNPIPCFPRLLSEQKDYKVSMVLPTLANFWRQDELNKVYGIDTIISAIDKNSPISNYFGSDKIVIDSLLNMPNDGRRLKIAVTMSMHTPYESIKPEVDIKESFEFPPSYTSQYCNSLVSN